ncbi:MAG: type II secretion system F family protein [Planctomycetaceae bacterium]|jgi:tight adherence protein B|nr:type II secretion system F family protein [Planctomycetaceae bacterium]MDG2388031.1 type II secretion system F family protein [Planctomycetaceae bacterium]
MVPLEVLMGSGFIGAGLAIMAWAGADIWGSGLDYLEQDFQAKFRRLRVRVKRLRTIILSWLAMVGVFFASLWIFLNLPVLGFVAAVIVFCLPWYLVRRMARRRKEKIEDQLADSMVSMASAIQAGLSLAQSLEILAEQSPHPISQEFQQMMTEYQLGKTLDEVLEETKERLESENFALFSAAMQASRASGGRLNDVIERIAVSIREMQRLERKVEAETAQARSSAVYMALAPFAILAMYYFFVDPVSTTRLFTTLVGQLILSMALVLDVVAYLWARRILNPDI